MDAGGGRNNTFKHPSFDLADKKMVVGYFHRRYCRYRYPYCNIFFILQGAHIPIYLFYPFFTSLGNPGLYICS